LYTHYPSYARFLTELPGFQVTALCDISPLFVGEIGKRIGVAGQYTDV